MGKTREALSYSYVWIGSPSFTQLKENEPIQIDKNVVSFELGVEYSDMLRY